MTHPIVRVTVIDTLVERLEQAVLDGEFPVGHRLPSETELAREHQVSRPIVREALARLRERGYIETINGRGTFVTRPGIDALAQSVLRRIREHKSDEFTVDQLYEVRAPVELEAVTLAATRIDTEGLAELERQLERMQRSTDDPEAYTAADIAFHLGIAESTGNPLFSILTSPLIDLIIHGIFQSVLHTHDGMISGIEEHGVILERLRAGDAKGAREAMAQHLAHSRDVHPGTVYGEVQLDR